MLSILAAAVLASVTLVAAAGAAAGDLDPSFGADGKVVTDFGYGEGALAVVVQPDGRIVAAGSSSPDGYVSDFALVRYNADGSLDSSFGSDGKVLTDVGPGPFDRAHAVALQPDGRIVAAGCNGRNCFFGEGGGNDFALVRFNADGSLDSSFGSDGKVVTDLGDDDFAWGVALQPDGKIVAAGFVDAGGEGWDFALVRYNADGTLDSSFGDSGKVVTDIRYQDEAFAVALQPDGKIVAAGYANGNLALARYKRDGSLDSRFGAGGIVLTAISPGYWDEVRAIALQPDTRIVAAGTTTTGGTELDFALVRYNRDGSRDSSFGRRGIVVTDFGGEGDHVHAVAVQPDDRIVAIGYGNPGHVNYFALARYDADGSLDASFGSGGKVLTDFGGGGADGGALQPDGRIVAAGYGNVEGSEDFALARYLGCLPRPVREREC